MKTKSKFLCIVEGCNEMNEIADGGSCLCGEHLDNHLDGLREVENDN